MIPNIGEPVCTIAKMMERKAASTQSLKLVEPLFDGEGVDSGV